MINDFYDMTNTLPSPASLNALDNNVDALPIYVVNPETGKGSVLTTDYPDLNGNSLRQLNDAIGVMEFGEDEEWVEDLNSVVEKVEATTEKIRVFIIHHGDADGYAAGATALNTMSCKEKTMVALPVAYGQPFPLNDLTSTDEIYILDFSYDRSTLDQVYAQVSKLVVLDHHETARAALEGAPYAHFDMSKSGVLLAWEYFVPEYPASEAVMLLNAYDLWLKEDPVYKWSQVVAFQMACETQLKNMSFWTALMNGYFIDKKLWTLGYDLQQRFQTSVDEIHESPLTENHVIHGKNFVFFFAEHQLSLLCDAVYSDSRYNADAVICLSNPEDNHWRFSLRSPSTNNFEVHEIAKQLGGGGHKKAAGFKAEVELPPEEMVEWLKLKLEAISF